MRTVFVLTILVLVLAAPSARAIEFESFGVKAGGAITSTQFTFEGTDELDNDTRMALVAGVSTMWQLQRRSAFRIVVEGLYVRKGYEGERSLVDIDPEPVDVNVAASYFSLPVVGRVLFVEEDLSVYAVFGPSLEFLLDNDDDVLLDEFSSWSLALNVGIGLEYELGDRAQAQFELRFNRDVTDNFEGDDELFRIDEVVHQALQITGGLRF